MEKKVKLPRRRKKRYLQHNSRQDYRLGIIAAEVCMEQDEQDRGFNFHSKFPMRFGKGIKRFTVIQNW